VAREGCVRSRGGPAGVGKDTSEGRTDRREIEDIRMRYLLLTSLCLRALVTGDVGQKMPEFRESS
jgi:hypothetical protein